MTTKEAFTVLKMISAILESKYERGLKCLRYFTQLFYSCVICSEQREGKQKC